MPTAPNNSAVPPLRDKDNLDSELSPEDLDVPDPEPSESDEALVRLMDERYQAASSARRSREPQMFLSLAFYLGEQNLGWSTNGRKLIDTRNLGQGWKSWTTRNLIKGKVLTLLGQATQTAPTAIASPLTDSDMDQQAAGEARSLLAHLDQLHDRSQQTSEALLWALTSSTACLKIWWDPDAEADVPLLDDPHDPSKVTGSTRAKVGEICEEVVPIFDLYIDPKARRWDRVGWIIHEQVRDLDYVQQRYGRNPDGSRGPGWSVKADAGAGTGNAGYIESRMASLVGDAQGSSQSTKSQVCTVRECWEYPSARYPDGRLFTTAGDVVLRRPEPWPIKKSPFVPLSYLNGQGTVYGHNAVWDCIGAQRTYNAAVRRLEEYLANPWGRWFAERGSEIDPDALNDPEEIVYYNDGSQRPEYFPPPPVADVIPKAIEISDANLNDLSGVRAVSEGDTPPGVTAASAIAQLSASDATQLKHCLTNVETFSKQRADVEIAYAAKFYSEPRLIGIQDVVTQGPAQAAAPDGSGVPPRLPALTEMKAFQALTQGGSCRVTVSPGSAIPQSPQARQQQISDLFKMLMGPAPLTPDLLAIFVTMLKGMEIEGGDDVVQELTNLLARMQAEQKAAAQAARADQQRQQAQQLAAQQAQLQSQQQGDLIRQAMDQMHQVGVKQNDLHGQLALLAAKHGLDQHDKFQDMAVQTVMPPAGQDGSAGGPGQGAPVAPAQGDAL